jgi:hypothetical protein
LSHIGTQKLSHAALRSFFAQSEVEVIVMTNEGRTQCERDIAMIEQTLQAVIQIDPTVARLSVGNPQQSTGDVILVR